MIIIINLVEILEDYKIKENEINELYQQIHDITDLEFEAYEIKCKCVYFDIEEEYVTITPLNSKDKLGNDFTKDISFKDFEILLNYSNKKR